MRLNADQEMDALLAIEIIEGEGADFDTTVAAWQYLVDSGLAWQLQGFYGRTAAALIKQGILRPKPLKD